MHRKSDPKQNSAKPKPPIFKDLGYMHFIKKGALKREHISAYLFKSSMYQMFYILQEKSSRKKVNV